MVLICCNYQVNQQIGKLKFTGISKGPLVFSLCSCFCRHNFVYYCCNWHNLFRTKQMLPSVSKKDIQRADKILYSPAIWNSFLSVSTCPPLLRTWILSGNHVLFLFLLCWAVVLTTTNNRRQFYLHTTVASLQWHYVTTRLNQQARWGHRHNSFWKMCILKWIAWL